MKYFILPVLLAALAHASVLKFNSSSSDPSPESVTWYQRMRNMANFFTKGEAAQTNPDVWPPAFCNELDCPKYELVAQTKDYEIRRYAVSHWVGTSMTGIDYANAGYKMFMKLYNYISGGNAKQEKIAMTAPVINRLIPGQGPACEDNFTMSFFLAPKVGDAPAPSDNTVYLNEMAPMTVYVRAFAGFASMEDYLKAAQELATALPSNATFHTEFYYTAGYDAPFKIFNRHNEIWFIGK